MEQMDVWIVEERGFSVTALIKDCYKPRCNDLARYYFTYNFFHMTLNQHIISNYVHKQEHPESQLALLSSLENLQFTEDLFECVPRLADTRKNTEFYRL